MCYVWAQGSLLAQKRGAVKNQNKQHTHKQNSEKVILLREMEAEIHAAYMFPMNLELKVEDSLKQEVINTTLGLNATQEH